MIFVIFICIAVSYYLFQYLDKRRKVQNEEQQEKRKESFISLLHSLKEKDKDSFTQKNEENT